MNAEGGSGKGGGGGPGREGVLVERLVGVGCNHYCSREVSTVRIPDHVRDKALHLGLVRKPCRCACYRTPSKEH